MRRILSILLTLLLLCGVCYAEPPDTTNDASYPHFYGRLTIPDVGIDVALYRDQHNKQGAVDRRDSACYFRMSNGGWVIADHYTQGFSTPHAVEVGMEAVIVDKDGAASRLVCVEVLDGINTGHGITDKNGRVEHGRHDILMYTCIGDGNWRNVLITQWDMVTN